MYYNSREKIRKLTIPHSHSQGGEVKLDIMDLQHMHEELQSTSAHRISPGDSDPRVRQQKEYVAVHALDVESQTTTYLRISIMTPLHLGDVFLDLLTRSCKEARSQVSDAAEV